MQRMIETGPCFPLASAPPAGCNPQIFPTAKSARPAGSAARHDLTTNPQRGSQLNKLIPRFYEASSRRDRPLPPPAPQFPPAARGAKSKWETRPQGPRCSASVPSKVHEGPIWDSPGMSGEFCGAPLPRSAHKPLERWFSRAHRLFDQKPTPFLAWVFQRIWKLTCRLSDA